MSATAVGSAKRFLFTGAALCVATVVALMAAAPASAAIIGGPYSAGPTDNKGGRYTYIDCSGCDQDDEITVSNFKDGYGTRTYFYGLVSGKWITYTKKYSPDNTASAYIAGSPPIGSKVRIQICATNKAGTNIGVCFNAYTYNSK